MACKWEASSPTRITTPARAWSARRDAARSVESRNGMLRKAFEGEAGVSPSSGCVISIYDMLIPSYEFHDIPRTTGMDPTARRRRQRRWQRRRRRRAARSENVSRRKEEAKSYLTKADRCHSPRSPLFFPLPFPFSEASFERVITRKSRTPSALIKRARRSEDYECETSWSGESGYVWKIRDQNSEPLLARERWFCANYMFAIKLSEDKIAFPQGAIPCTGKKIFAICRYNQQEKIIIRRTILVVSVSIILVHRKKNSWSNWNYNYILSPNHTHFLIVLTRKQRYKIINIIVNFNFTISCFQAYNSWKLFFL